MDIRYAFFGVIGLAFLAGCGSSTTVARSEFDETGGTIGFAGAENAAGQMVEETGGTGADVSVSGSGGVVDQPTGGTGNDVPTGGSETGGDNTGGELPTGGQETGGDNTGGEVPTGGELPTGGTAGNAGDTGTGGDLPTGGTGTCTPKTCLTIAVELAGGMTDPVPEACGLVEDGCGNLIDCGGCSIGECGEAEPSVFQGNRIDGTPNLCGGGCVAGTQYETGAGDNIECGVGDPEHFPGYEWYCSEGYTMWRDCWEYRDADPAHVKTYCCE